MQFLQDEFLSEFRNGDQRFSGELLQFLRINSARDQTWNCSNCNCNLHRTTSKTKEDGCNHVDDKDKVVEETSSGPFSGMIPANSWGSKAFSSSVLTWS